MAAKATTKPAGVPALQQRFHDTEASMALRIFERATPIKTALIALAAKAHVFHEGKPGVAKSYTFDTLVKHISGLQPEDVFTRQINAYMTDSDIFGGPDMLAMEQGVYQKFVDRTLVTAKIAFLDELWKGNGSMWDSLLKATNERQFDNGPDTIDMPLWSLFIASNEYPGDDHQAIADRIHFWHIIPRIRESSNRIAMLQSQTLGPVVPTLSVSDIEIAQKETDKVEVALEVYEALDQLYLDLFEEGVEVTDRRLAQCLPAIRATAWWRGSEEANVDDMHLIRHILWRRPEHIPIVDTHVLQLASPLEAEALAMRATIDDLGEQLQSVIKDSDNPQQRNRKAMELHGKLDQFADEVENLEGRIAVGGRRSDLTNELRDRVVSYTDTLLAKCFSIDPSMIPR
jgi:MoxR-like ATPase